MICSSVEPTAYARLDKNCVVIREGVRGRVFRVATMNNKNCCGLRFCVLMITENFTKLHGVISLKMAVFIDRNCSLIQAKLYVVGGSSIGFITGKKIKIFLIGSLVSVAGCLIFSCHLLSSLC
jgi:hypothetical protein